MFPPSVDKKISTLAAFTPFAVVPATAHVTLWVVPTFQTTLVLGELTKNGPAVPLTETIISSLLFAPPPALLSLTVKRKFKVLATLGTASQVHDVAPVLTTDKFGKYLLLSVVGK